MRKKKEEKLEENSINWNGISCSVHRREKKEVKEAYGKIFSFFSFWFFFGNVFW